jgi:hypothetical protein
MKKMLIRILNLSFFKSCILLCTSSEQIYSISGSMLNRFCNNILPRIHKNIKSLILDSVYMDCIFRADNYPNLTELKLFNFNNAILSRYFVGKIFMYTMNDVGMLFKIELSMIVRGARMKVIIDEIKN